MNLVPAPVIDGVGGRPRSPASGPSTSTSATAAPDAIPFGARVEVVEYLGDEQLVHMTRKDTDLQAKLPVEERITWAMSGSSRSRGTSCCSSTR